MPKRSSREPDGPPLVSEHVLEVGARIERGPSDLLIRMAFSKELDDQAGLFEAISLGDLAHTLVIMEAGIVPQDAGQALIAALLQLHRRPADFTPDPARGDLYTNREAWLATQTSASKWLGAGRARREATTTAFLIKLRGGLLRLAEALTTTGKTLAARAREFRSSLLPDYTYLQSAQPTSFGHYLLGFTYPILRDLDRIRGLYGRVNLSPGGCGSTNGSRLPQDRGRLSELLGFDGLVTHARDAMWQADLPIEAVAVLTAVLINLDRLAEDLQIYATGVPITVLATPRTWVKAKGVFFCGMILLARPCRSSISMRPNSSVRADARRGRCVDPPASPSPPQGRGHAVTNGA